MPKLSLLHPLALLIGGILLAAAMSYVLPAGSYERREDAATGRQVVVPGSYQRVAPAPLNPWEALVALPKGITDAIPVIIFVFLTGAAFTVVDETGALQHSVDWLIRKLHRQDKLVVPLTALIFSFGGIMFNMQEEFIALVPVLLLLVRRLGYDPLTAVAMSTGVSAVGASFSPINPFQVGVAQKISEVPLLSGSAFRIVFLVLAVVIWIGGILRHAERVRITPEAVSDQSTQLMGFRHGLVMLLLGAAFAIFIYGILALDWDFDQMGVLFFVMGMLTGLIGGLGVDGTARALVKGFEAMAFSALLIGFARTIFVVLEAGQIIDTIVYALFTPLEKLPVAASAIGMMAVQSVIHVPVPSVSGQAALTLPVLLPLSDLLGLSRQVTILAYQYGAGLCELLTPTNGALMATLAAAGVRLDHWVKFAVPLVGLLFLLGVIAIIAGILVGLA